MLNFNFVRFYFTVISGSWALLLGTLEPTQGKQSFSVTKKPKIVDEKVDKRVTELKELDKKTAGKGMRYTLMTMNKNRKGIHIMKILVLSKSSYGTFSHLSSN